MALGWFTGRSKPTFKPIAHQKVEIEFEHADGSFQAHFVEILETPKKRLVLRAPEADSSIASLSPGMAITISYFDSAKDTFFSIVASVRESRDDEFDIDLPKERESDSIAKRDDSFRIEVAMPVKYQAMRSAHSQLANTAAVTPSSLFLKTNLAIPPETPLQLVLEIPNTPHIAISGRAKGSEKDVDDPRKHISEVQFDDIGSEDRNEILNYAVYYSKRAERAEKRGGAAS